MTILENEVLKVTIAHRGAELTSILHKEFQLEYLWQASPLFWAKHSPVLFPIVGALKGNEYVFQDKRYSLGRHGFAREKLFELTDHNPESAEFHIKADEKSLENFPFEFELNIRYELSGPLLSVIYTVYNPGDSSMFFSLGAHPAFNVPLEKQLAYDDYFLEFDESEVARRWPITKDGLISKMPETFFDNTRLLPLSYKLFAKDALVFKELKSKTISIKSNKSQRGLHFRFSDFPYMGLWAAPNADFVCIEPWCGIADSEDSTQQLEEKEGINRLEPGGHFVRSWSVELF